MVCKERQLEGLPEELVSRVRASLNRNMKYNAKVIDVKARYGDYTVYIEWGNGIFTMYNWCISSEGKTSEVISFNIIADDIEVILRQSKYFASKNSSGS